MTKLPRNELGLMTVGVKAGGYDDAVHVKAKPLSRKTLCDQRARTRNVVVLGDELPDDMAGCWTCLIEALRRVA